MTSESAVVVGAVAADDAAHAHEVAAPEPGSFPGIGGPMRTRRFGVSLAVIVACALAFRVGYVLLVTRHQNGKLYDSFWYYSTTIGLHSGQFFRAPFSYAPTAAHPPMTSLLLGGISLIVGLHGITSPLLTMAALGSAVVLCVGLLGRAVAGPWVGLTAATLAALSPNFWMPSGILMSETPSMLFMALILLAVVRFARAPTVLSAKFYETAKFFTLTRHIYNPFGAFISDRSLQKLPAAQRDGLLQAVKSATDDHFDRAAQVEVSAIEQLRKLGVTVAECDRAVFRERVQPMWNRFAEKTPGAKALLDAVRQTEKA